MQEYLKTVLNSIKHGLFFTILVAFGSFAQQSANFSLQLSVEPSTTLLPGQQGVMTFTITNGGTDNLTFLFGGAQPSNQDSGQGHTLLVFDSFHFGTCTTGSIFIQPPPVIPPLWAFEVRDLAAGATEVCQVHFIVPEDTTSDFTTFSFQLNQGVIRSNVATVRIDIQPQTFSVPSLSLDSMMFLCLLMPLAISLRLLPHRYKQT